MPGAGWRRPCSSSNFWFWHDDGLFRVQREVNAMLHTWSLAVEEQFYICLPALSRALGGGSAWEAHDSQSTRWRWLPSSSRCLRALPPGRGLLRGAHTSLGTARRRVAGAGAVPKIEWAWLRETLAAVGLAMIVAGCLLFYKNMPFPGERALVPCIGAALLIHAGTSGSTLVGRLLSLRPLVLVGLISYSLYLWHWPIIIFFRIWSARPIGSGEGALLLAVSFAAAMLSGALSSSLSSAGWWRPRRRRCASRRRAASPAWSRSGWDCGIVRTCGRLSGRGGEACELHSLPG